MKRSRRRPGSAAGLAVACAALGIALVACGGDSGSGSSSPASSASPGPTQNQRAPSATFTLTGDTGVAGPITNVSSRLICALPGLTGTAITDFGTTVTSTVAAFIILKSDTLEVRLSSGSGSTLAERIFSGANGPGYSTDHGGTVRSALSETTPSGSKVGTVGRATMISGTVDCGGEGTGTSSVTIAGTTALGQASGGFAAVRVVCETYSNGRAVGLIGLTHIGQTIVQFNISLNNTGTMSVFYASANRMTGFFSSAAGSSNGSLSAGGAHFDGSATDAAGTGATIKVKGDATCGSTAAY